MYDGGGGNGGGGELVVVDDDVGIARLGGVLVAVTMKECCDILTMSRSSCCFFCFFRNELGIFLIIIVF